MVSFRFHLISLVAVFLALSVGIGMGVTVIDKATVDSLQRNFDNVRNEVNAANQRSSQLQSQLDRYSAYETESAKYLFENRLQGRPVVFVGVRGTDQGPLGDLRQSITDAQGNVTGTLWFTRRAAMDDRNVAGALQQDLGLPGADANTLRQAVLSRLAAVLAGGTPTSALEPILEAGVLEWQGESGNNNVSGLDFGTSRVVLASGPRPDVSNDAIAKPLARLLANQPTKRVVAVESGKDSDGRNQAERAVFLGMLRGDGAINDKLSTVDNIETQSGRVATVLALSQLPDRVGDYGVGSGTDSIIPKLPS